MAKKMAVTNKVRWVQHKDKDIEYYDFIINIAGENINLAYIDKLVNDWRITIRINFGGELTDGRPCYIKEIYSNIKTPEEAKKLVEKYFKVK